MGNHNSFRCSSLVFRPNKCRISVRLIEKIEKKENCSKKSFVLWSRVAASLKMASLAPIFKKAYMLLFASIALYTVALIAKNQITPFNFSTPDGETIYAWHVMPLGLYAKHEYEILQQPSGCAEDITKTKAFQLLKNDPDARLIINFHGVQIRFSSLG